MEFRFAPAPADNPLKGFVPYAVNHDSHGALEASLEWSYIPFSALSVGPQTFKWDALEAVLERARQRGRQAVFRIVLDQPDEPGAFPAWMAEAGVTLRRYKEHGGGLSPDYDHPLVARTLRLFIREFGRRYDGDPRIGFVTAGLLGFWGEWHTWPHEDWFASEKTRESVLEAYEKAFEKTPILLRYGIKGASARGFGYHDDSFAHATLEGEDWHFMPGLGRVGESSTWTRHPIGGEVRPELQLHIVRGTRHGDMRHEDFDTCVERAHPTWLLFEEAFNTKKPAELERVRALARSLGYEYQVTGSRIVRRDRSLTVIVEITNRGAAPFYAPWPIQITLSPKSGGEPVTVTTDVDVEGILPESTKTIEIGVRLPELGPGHWKVGIRVPNPMKSGRPLRFANEGCDAGTGILTIGSFDN